MAAHVPFVLSQDGTRLESHLVRSNPLVRALKAGEIPALTAVSGPDGYVSPDWYGAADQVPTWNYVAVHLRGPLRLEPEARLKPILAAISEAFEPRLAPKRPWTMDKMDPDALGKLMRAIVTISMDLEQVEGNRKLNQNKVPAA